MPDVEEVKLCDRFIQSCHLMGGEFQKWGNTFAEIFKILSKIQHLESISNSILNTFYVSV